MTFPFRQMQSLVDIIGEERIFLDITSEIRTAYKVRVKTQRIALRLEILARVFNADDLPRCQTDDRAF